MTDEERAEFERLAVFFGQVASEPGKFPVTGAMARRVQSIVRAARGPAKPSSRRNRRKERQERRQGAAKRRRRERAQTVAAYNEARERVAAEVAELEALQAEQLAKLEAEPKFDVVNMHGQTVLAGIPESMIVPQPAELTDEPERGQLLLPGSHEKAMEREAS